MCASSSTDTNLCADAVVPDVEFVDSTYSFILHTARDADLDMNTDIDYGARIRELFETMQIVTV